MAHYSLGTLAGDVSQDRENQRHSCPMSEPYAPVEVLLGYLCQGWVLDDLVVTETHSFGSHRHPAIYFFTLRRDDARIRIPLLENPVALRVVNNYRLKMTEAIGGNSDHGSTDLRVALGREPYRRDFLPLVKLFALFLAILYFLSIGLINMPLLLPVGLFSVGY